MKSPQQIVDETIEDIQEAQVEAGGRFLRRSEIENMTVKELLTNLVPNNVKFTIRHERK